MSVSPTFLFLDAGWIVVVLARKLNQLGIFTRDEIKDVMQEGNLKLWECAIKWKPIPGGAKFQSYAYTRVFFGMIDYIKNIRRNIKINWRCKEPPVEVPIYDEDSRFFIEELFENSDLYLTLERTLSPLQFQVIIMTIFEHKKQWEIAEILNVSQANICGVLKTSKKLLKEYYWREHGKSSGESNKLARYLQVS